MTIIPFKTEEKKRDTSPEAALKLLLEGIRQEDTTPEDMVIAWNEVSNDGIFKLRYLIAGPGHVASVVGLLEMVKQEILEDDE